jgi:hypothetical protein
MEFSMTVMGRMGGRGRPTPAIPVERSSAPQPSAHREDILAQAMAVSLAAGRMMVKNRIIVGTLRHHLDYLPDYYAAAATEALLDLASQAETSRAQIVAHTPYIVLRAATRNRPKETARLKELQGLYRDLSLRLADMAGDTEAVAALVDEARVAAWREISGI